MHEGLQSSCGQVWDGILITNGFYYISRGWNAYVLVRHFHSALDEMWSYFDCSTFLIWAEDANMQNSRSRKGLNLSVDLIQSFVLATV